MRKAKKKHCAKESKKERNQHPSLKNPQNRNHVITHPLNMKSAGVFTEFTNRQKYYRITQCAKDSDSADKSTFRPSVHY